MPSNATPPPQTLIMPAARRRTASVGMLSGEQAAKQGSPKLTPCPTRRKRVALTCHSGAGQLDFNQAARYTIVIARSLGAARQPSLIHQRFPTARLAERAMYGASASSVANMVETH